MVVIPKLYIEWFETTVKGKLAERQGRKVNRSKIVKDIEILLLLRWLGCLKYQSILGGKKDEGERKSGNDRKFG